MVLGMISNAATRVAFEWDGRELRTRRVHSAAGGIPTRPAVSFSFDNVTFCPTEGMDGGVLTWVSPAMISRDDARSGVLVHRDSFVSGSLHPSACWALKGNTLCSMDPDASPTSTWLIQGSVPQAVLAGFVAAVLNQGVKAVAPPHPGSPAVLEQLGLSSAEVMDTFHFADMVYNDVEEESEFESTYSSDSYSHESPRPLQDAASKGDLLEVEYLLDEGVHANMQDEQGWSAVHHAAAQGHAELIPALLLRGARADTKDASGLSPLHIAASRGHCGCIQALVRHGALVEVTDNHGRSPLHLAAQKGHRACVASLVAFRACPRACDGSGWAPLHYAVSEGRASVASLLLECGAQPGQVSHTGETPLAVAQRTGQLPCAQVVSSV